MAEENHEIKTSHESVGNEEVEKKDRGLFDFMKKKEEGEEGRPAHEKSEVIATEFEQKVQVSEPEEVKTEENKDHGLFEKLHRSDSSSSSSSEEEEGGEGEEKKKKKKKKGLKEKIKEKITGDDDDEKREEDTAVPVEKCEEEKPSDEKKGFLDKIKEKLPGHGKKPEEHVPLPPQAETHEHQPEKKGILEKIKEKLPGYHPKNDEEKKEKESAAVSSD